MEKGFHAISSEEVFKKLNVVEKGLFEQEVKKRRTKSGYNIIEEKDKSNYFFVFLRQFRSFLIYILFVAATISYFIGNHVDMYVIFGVILINSAIGFFQEQKAEKSIKALKKIVVTYAKVYRNNQLIKVDSKDLVPGDVIFLEEGDKVPADARIFFVRNFKTVESSLTGESEAVDKVNLVLDEKISLADRKNCVFMGTFVASGIAKAVVYSIGKNTAIGNIATTISGIKEERSHFSKKTDKLAIQMAVIASIGAGVTFLVAYFVRDFEFTNVFLFTIASLVSGIPEGLPAVLTIVLSIGALRMSRRKAIIRNLPATETLAVVDTIITDKTGTLTENTMNIQEIFVSGSGVINVTGEGWEPKGEFLQDNKKFSIIKNKPLMKLLKICSVCNSANLVKEKKSYNVVGDPTEAALAVVAEKAGLKKESSLDNKIDDMPFNQDLRYRASLFLEKDKKEIFVVGAPEEILSKSKFFLNGENKFRILKKDRDNILAEMESMAKRGKRVLGVAYRNVESTTKGIVSEQVNEMVFTGLVGMSDPLRKEIKGAVEKAHLAGIRVVMVTGDHKTTAIAIAKEIGLVGQKFEAFEQKELENLSEKDFKKVVRTVNVFARLTPKMKMKIATCLQDDGHKIAMTGDGINDAPALKKADIGISMGIVGVDVARESSDIILTDDNFASIINAIEEGRIVYENTKQTSYFLVATNFAEHVTIVTTLLAGMPLPLLPIQLLWLNLVTDTGAGIGLASEPRHNHIIEEKPKDPEKNILSKDILPFLISIAVIMAVLTVMAFKFYFVVSLDKARTGAFVVMAFCQIFNSFNMRSLKKSLFNIGIFNNKVLNIGMVISIAFILGLIYMPFFQNIFSFVPLTFSEFGILVAGSSIVFIFGEIYKFIKRR